LQPSLQNDLGWGVCEIFEKMFCKKIIYWPAVDIGIETSQGLQETMQCFRLDRDISWIDPSKVGAFVFLN
jgi:hypothetical protein